MYMLIEKEENQWCTTCEVVREVNQAKALGLWWKLWS